jgi:YfiR/HmsC-like
MPQTSSNSGPISGRNAGVLVFVLALALLALLPPVSARGQEAALREYDIKAACLFNIVKFSDWPAEAFPKAGAPLIIGVMGDDPFGPILDQIIKGRVVNDRPIVIKRSRDLAELKNAHVVFVCASERSRVARICAALEGSNVLCVGDTKESLAHAAINFSITDNRVVFTVNLSRASRAGVSISSKLLALAKEVTGERPKSTR